MRVQSGDSRYVSPGALRPEARGVGEDLAQGGRGDVEVGRQLGGVGREEFAKSLVQALDASRVDRDADECLAITLLPID
jgi:uncharacterized membrane protein